jgi:energy-coupling factor transporter ATP-binding protein EcfA2
MPRAASSEPYYYSEPIGRLLIALEEATRAVPEGGPTTFVAPAGGQLDQALARFHHILFGRRGSGKTSLLRHLERQLRREGRGVVWIDQEIFMELSFPDVLVSSVLEVMKGIRSAVRAAAGIAPRPKKRTLADRLLRRNRPPRLSDDQEGVLASLDRAVANLDTIKFAPNDRKVEWTREVGSERSVEALGSVAIPPVSGNMAAKRTESVGVTSSETIESSKEEYLERSLTNFRELLRDAAKLCAGGFVFLDDFYRVERHDQPLVLGYLHRLVKDTGFWLKVGSIRYWTTTYRGGSPPRGIQLHQDANEIALDRGLQLAGTSQQFLESILTSIASGIDADLDQLLTPGTRTRLVLASGGVARDYLRLTSQAVNHARNRGPSAKVGSGKVMAEDVNQAAGATAPAKLADLQEDAPAEAAALQELLVDLTEFCRRQKAAYFLIDSQDADLSARINQLQDLRFAHLLVESETLPDEGSRRYKVLLLDISQLSAQRALEVDFDGWSDRSKRRRRRLVYSQDAGFKLRTAPAKAEPAVADIAPPAEKLFDLDAPTVLP